MSELVELNAPYYIIRPIAAGDEALTGVGRIQPTSQPVRIDADITIWKIKPQVEPGVFRLSLKDSYPYTGFSGVPSDPTNVIATHEASEDREWYIRFWPEYGGYTIGLQDYLIPPTWTFSPETPDILLTVYEIPRRSQLFKIEPAVE